MSQFNGKAPGMDYREQGETAVKAASTSNAIGIVGVAMKGPMDTTLITTPQQCIAIFGEPHANNCAIQGALACLENSREVWFKRVVSKDAAKGVTWVDGEVDGNGDPIEKPWAVFTTKETTSLLNGYTVTLEWKNEGTEDEPDYKITYVLTNTLGVAVETFTCDENSNSDLYIGRIIGLYSSYLDIAISGDLTNRDKTTLVIAGGDSGIEATADDIVGAGNSGMKAFYDTEAYDIATLVVPGWADVKVWKEGIALGKYRNDIVFIPSLPSGLKPEQVCDLVRGAGEFTTTGYQFNETFVATYWPNGLLRNSSTGGYDIVDIAPYIAAAYANSDAVANVWTAPAGVKRGTIKGLDGLEYNTSKEERDMLYSEEINVNTVVNLKNYGLTIMGARTSKIYKITDAATALRYVNVRRLCNYIRKVVLSESMNNLFDQNDYYTWNDWRLRIDPYLRGIKEDRGIYDYEVVMDETTVTQADIDEGRMPGLIRIAPIKPNEYIVISFIVAKDGTVSFDEEETA